MIPDPHELRLRWIDALRDADPTLQLRGYLTHGNHHCAVGIAASALQEELGVVERETCFTDTESAANQVTSAAIACRLALLLDVDRIVIGEVMNLNDTDCESFAQIADHLKETLL